MSSFSRAEKIYLQSKLKDEFGSEQFCVNNSVLYDDTPHMVEDVASTIDSIPTPCLPSSFEDDCLNPYPASNDVENVNYVDSTVSAPFDIRAEDLSGPTDHFSINELSAEIQLENRFGPVAGNEPLASHVRPGEYLAQFTYNKLLPSGTQPGGPIDLTCQSACDEAFRGNTITQATSPTLSDDNTCPSGTNEDYCPPSTSREKIPSSRRSRQLHPYRRNTPSHGFMCEACSGVFKRRSDLTRHMKIHSRESEPAQWVCRVCKKSLSRKDSLRRHVNRSSKGCIGGIDS